MTVNQVPEVNDVSPFIYYYNTHYGFFPAVNWSFEITITSLGAAGFYEGYYTPEIPANIKYSWTFSDSGNDLTSGPGPNAWYQERTWFWKPENYSSIDYQYYRIDFVLHADDFTDYGHSPLYIKPDIRMRDDGHILEDNTWETPYDVTQSGLNDFSGSFVVRTHPYGIVQTNIIQMILEQN